MYEPEANYPRELEIDIVPANQPNWISPNDPDPNANRTVHWLTDSVRLQKCDEISLTKLSRKGRHFAMAPCNWTGDPTYSEKQLDAVWHCVQGTYLSYDAIEHLKTIREILKTPNRAELVGATLGDIIDAATSQSGLAEAIENLENEGVAIFGQRISTFVPWEDYRECWQGIGCDKAEHGFLLIAGSEFDAAELTYGRWVNGSIYKERTSIAKIEQLNRTNDFE